MVLYVAMVTISSLDQSTLSAAQMFESVVTVMRHDMYITTWLTTPSLWAVKSSQFFGKSVDKVLD